MRATMVTLVILALAAVSPARDSHAQAQDAARDAQSLYEAVMSPYCPGKVLADCTSSSAAELRAEIRRRLEAGETADAILTDLYVRFGDEIRPAPPPDSAWGRWLRIVPLIVVMLSLAGLAWYVTRRRPSRPVAVPPGEDPDLARRLEEELRAED